MFHAFNSCGHNLFFYRSHGTKHFASSAKSIACVNIILCVNECAYAYFKSFYYFCDEDGYFGWITLASTSRAQRSQSMHENHPVVVNDVLVLISELLMRYELPAIIKIHTMQKSTSNLMIGFFLGAATGTVLGLLFAPDKGSNTRKKIKIVADEITGEATNNINQHTKNIKGHVYAIFHELGEMFEGLESNLTERLFERMDDAEMLLKENADKYGNFH